MSRKTKHYPIIDLHKFDKVNELIVFKIRQEINYFIVNEQTLNFSHYKHKINQSKCTRLYPVSADLRNSKRQ